MISKLAKKLYLKANYRVLIRHKPEGLDDLLRPLPEGVVVSAAAQGQYDLVLLFVKDSQVLVEEAAAFPAILKPNAVLWIAYPKKSSGIETDLTRDEGWAGLHVNWRPVAQIAVNDTWSALRWRPKEHQTSDSQLEAQYKGKEHLKPIYDQLLEIAHSFGNDITLGVRKTYVALSRKKQFAVIVPSTKMRVDLGFKFTTLPTSPRLSQAKNLGSGSITHKVPLTTMADIDQEVMDWLRFAYDSVA